MTSASWFSRACDFAADCVHRWPVTVALVGIGFAIVISERIVDRREQGRRR